MDRERDRCECPKAPFYCTMRAARRTVEVEKKVRLRAGSAVLLAARGARLVSRSSFRDEYWGEALCVRDRWLRRRGGAWQIKLPLPGGGAGGCAAKAYEEVEGEREVLEAVRATLGAAEGEPPSDPAAELDLAERALGETLERSAGLRVERLLLGWGVRPYAVFGTERTTYEVEGAPGVRLDVDEASFGHCVAELEVLAEVGGEEDARRRIASAERLLGDLVEPEADPGAPATGKLDAWLQRYSAELHALLVANGLFRAR